MIWVEVSDTFYVFHAEEQQTFEQLIGPPRLKPGASVDNRVGETPPPGAFEPVSGFGLIWRGEVDGLEGVRQRLGWATAPEIGFSTAHQCGTAGRGAWTCYLLGPSGRVLLLHPDSTAQVYLLWEEWHGLDEPAGLETPSPASQPVTGLFVQSDCPMWPIGCAGSPHPVPSPDGQHMAISQYDQSHGAWLEVEKFK